MVRIPATTILILAAILFGFDVLSAEADERSTRHSRDAPQRPFGLNDRVLWQTSHVQGRPEPPLPFKAKRLYGDIQFSNPTVLTSAPGTDRLFVAEQRGNVYSIPDDPTCKQADLFLDIEELLEQYNRGVQEQDRVRLDSVYGLTFHPQFASNRFCYLCYVVRYADQGRGRHPQGTRVVRLKVTDQEPQRAVVESEVEIIHWLQGGHNGGCLKFGRDGKLFISTGDGAPAFPPDELRSGQDVSNLLSSILRIDVDHPTENRPYSIPEDNPFAQMPAARGEIWAYGLRNPWKISVDRKSGDLWVGDVGWQLWEMVYRVHPGDNYGWSLVEGSQKVHTQWEQGPTPLVKATVEIPHTEGASVTGGFVYRGKRFPELYGHYVFGDYVTRRIWHIPTEGDEPGPHQELVEPTVRIAGFAERHDGELLLLDYDSGVIHQLVRNEQSPGQPSTGQHHFPGKLSESGLFDSVEEHRLAGGVIPFSIQAPMWADHATAERFLAIPGDSSIALHTQMQRIPGSYFRSSMSYPENAVVAKTLSLELVAGDPSTSRRIETQLLHFNGLEWRGYSYRWNNEQTDAQLVGASGETATFKVTDANYPGGQRLQQWRFSSRLECMRCHNEWAQSTLAFQLHQINRDHQYGEVTDNQIRTLRHIGVLKNIETLPDVNTSFAAIKPHLPAEHLPALVDPLDESADLYLRGRSYLHANCAHCHREHGGGASRIHISFEKPLAKTEALKTRPTQGTFGIHQAEILSPGDPDRSVMYLRMAKSGSGHMPHIGAKMIDRRGLTLMHDWIRGLPSRTSLNTALQRLIELDETAARNQEQVESQRREELLAHSFAGQQDRETTSEEDRAQAAQQAKSYALSQVAARASERVKLVDELSASPEGAMLLARAHRDGTLPAAIADLVVQRTTTSTSTSINLLARDLFEAFLPDVQRSKRLGDSINPATLLAIQGDIERGKQLFLEGQGITCRNCHQVKGEDQLLGPALTHVGKKLSRSQILENILDPSKTIEPEFRTWLIETVDGNVYSGLLVSKTEQEITIRDKDRKEHRFETSEVENIIPQRKSLMPDLLLRDMSAQQVADLLTWLDSLK